MTVGLPGTGIGGMFYLLSAFAMPLRQLYRRMRGHVEPGRWRLMMEQMLLATGVLAGLWVTGWLLGLVVETMHQILPASAFAARGTHPGNLLRTASLLLSVGTLVMVLLGVELLRVCVRRVAKVEEDVSPVPLPRMVASTAGLRRASTRMLVALVLALAIDSRTALAQVTARLVISTAREDSVSIAATHMARADSAFRAGQPGLAAREYSLALAADPRNSRATFRLARLLEADPARALRLYQRYVTLEPSDPWGYIALGDALARAARVDEALQAYAQAARLAPRERDVVMGHARVLVRAGHTDAAIRAYGQWVAEHPRDAEAWQALGREWARAGRPGDAAQALERAQALAPDRMLAQRLAAARGLAAFAITPFGGGSRDSDGNETTTFGGNIDLAAQGPWRFGFGIDRARVADGLTALGVDHLTLRSTWHPRATLKVDAEGGATRMDAAGAGSASTFPTGQVRARWRAPASGPVVDLRARRSMLDGTPLLVANRVSRAEVGALVEFPVSRAVRLRGLARTAELSDSSDINHRTTYAGIVACGITPSVELSGQFHATRYDHASDAGYFAPALVHVAELGSYVEVGTANGLLLALDMGGGMQQVAEHGAELGSWKPALRLYSLMVVPLAAGRELRLEVDAENSPVASEVATTGPWRYGAATLSLRWALP